MGPLVNSMMGVINMSNFWIDYILFIILVGGSGLYIYFVFVVLAPTNFYDRRTQRRVAIAFKMLGSAVMFSAVVVPPVSEFILKG